MGRVLIKSLLQMKRFINQTNIEFFNNHRKFETSGEEIYDHPIHYGNSNVCLANLYHCDKIGRCNQVMGDGVVV